ncbi:MAG: iron ABC transporter permease [Candidatus Methanomethylophilaceae archaeon]
MSKVKEFYKANERRKLALLTVLIVLIVITMFVALDTGPTKISVTDLLLAIGHALFPNHISAPVNAAATPIIISVRMPRVFLAILAGVALGYSGTVMQATLRNPLVSPFTLGLSSAASFGAAVSIVMGSSLFGAFYSGSITIAGQYFGNSSIIMMLFAFIFGMLSIFLVYSISRRQRSSQSIIILAGVVIGYLFQAGITYLKYASNDEALREITLWLMGGMWGASWAAIFILLPIVIICFAAVMGDAVKFNALLGGDDVASNLGIDVPRLRLYSLVTVSLAASACIAFTGIIGFIGLMAPHICRMIIGNDQRYLIPVSALMGALILLVSDTVARVIIAPEELPVGVIMYLIGGIFFVYLITMGQGRKIE